MLSKFHGCGNTFLIDIFQSDIDYSKFAIKYCNEYIGIGSDGLILVKHICENDIKYEMVFYNKDGSRAPMCGNGIRCFCHYLYKNGIESSRNYKVKTLGGVMNINIESFDPFYVIINLGKPDFSCSKLNILTQEEEFLDKEIKINNKNYKVDCVFVATHHLVTIVDNINLVTEEDGFNLCNYRQFEKQINVNFLQVIDSENVLVKTYERGVGFTKACGTGGASCFVILKRKGLIRDRMINHLEFGELEYSENNGEIYMKGPSEEVCFDIKLKNGK